MPLTVVNGHSVSVDGRVVIWTRAQEYDGPIMTVVIQFPSARGPLALVENYALRAGVHAHCFDPDRYSQRTTPWQTWADGDAVAAGYAIKTQRVPRDAVRSQSDS